MAQNRLSDHACVGDGSEAVSVKVARGKYRTFDAWLTGELKKLEGRWASFTVQDSTSETRITPTR